jgi:hypothetical protein
MKTYYSNYGKGYSFTLTLNDNKTCKIRIEVSGGCGDYQYEEDNTYEGTYKIHNSTISFSIKVNTGDKTIEKKINVHYDKDKIQVFFNSDYGNIHWLDTDNQFFKDFDYPYAEIQN